MRIDIHCHATGKGTDISKIETEAVLIKLIPSTQHVHLMDASHRDFYDALHSANMPLLCHVGPEYSFPEGIREKGLDN
jgi:hypothetical protein